MKPIIELGLACDGFSITLDGVRIFIDQEDDATEKLKPFFERLGYHVELTEEY